MPACPRCHPDGRQTIAVADLCPACRARVARMAVLTWKREPALPAKGA